MSTEENKENIRRHVEEIWNKGNFDIIPELIASDYVAHSTGDDIKGIEGFKQRVVGAMRTAAPDINYKIDSLVGEGDIVAARYTASGTFTGKVGDIEPTGKKFTQKSAVFHRFKGGKQVEAWSYSDNLSFYQQLGIPIPG